MTEGERWAREVLEELRGSYFTLRAWIRFLRAPFVRADVRPRMAAAVGARPGWLQPST